MNSSISTTDNDCFVFHYPLPSGAEASEAHIAACIENQLSQVVETNTQMKHSNKRAEEERYHDADSKSQETGASTPGPSNRRHHDHHIHHHHGIKGLFSSLAEHKEEKAHERSAKATGLMRFEVGSPWIPTL